VYEYLDARQRLGFPNSRRAMLQREVLLRRTLSDTNCMTNNEGGL
jgi:hypothetical protein